MVRTIWSSLKALIARHWPRVRFRTLIFGTLLFTAALPGFGALFLRVYENALVRRTEAELVAQGSALAASAASWWPGYSAPAAAGPRLYRDSLTEIDLSTSPILPERPAPLPGPVPQAPAMVAAARLAPVIAETRDTTLAAIDILDDRGVIVPGGGSLAALPEVASALHGRPMTVFRRNGDYRRTYAFEWLSRASNLRLHHARPIRVNGRVVGVILLSRSPRALFRGIYEDRGKIALGVGLIFALLVLMSGILSRAIVRPVESLSRATRAMAAGRRMEAGRPSLQVVEINDLYDNFELMAQAIARRSQYLRNFAASVSHEFKTPLAGIRGAVELLEDHGDSMSAEERHRFLGNVAQDADRLSRLVKRLMELAQADMQLGAGSAAADIPAILTKVADGFRGGGLNVALDLPDSLPSGLIDPAGLEAIATTLIENSKQAGAATVSVSALGSDDGVAITFQDDGSGIAAADQARVFEPFFTSKRPSGGTGMGLSIARSLAEAHGGTLTLVAADGGARFALTLRSVT